MESSLVYIVVGVIVLNLVVWSLYTRRKKSTTLVWFKMLPIENAESTEKTKKTENNNPLPFAKGELGKHVPLLIYSICYPDLNHAKYSPNYKIWALGIILAIIVPVLCYLLYFLNAVVPFVKSVMGCKTDASTDWMLVVLPLGILASLLVLIALFLHAIVKIIKED